MSKCSRRDFLKLAGASAAVAVSGSAMAGENPFEFKTLEGGYQQVAAAQGNCGAQMKNATGNCGAQMKDAPAANAQKKGAQGNCGAQMKNATGNCGASMQKQDKKQSQEEGKCGYKMQ
ncbi:MAG: twin-arginine translocation signal domain-containing protein [Thiotrichales bacterium]|nr:twin-arginine translocation signal domain-containing protein [Thiotrichales bacterium]